MKKIVIFGVSKHTQITKAANILMKVIHNKGTVWTVLFTEKYSDCKIKAKQNQAHACQDFILPTK